MKTFISVLFTVSLAAGVSLSARQSGQQPAPAPAAPAAPAQQAPDPAGLPIIPPSPAVPLGAPPPTYVIGPSDVLKISVVDEGPEMRDQLATVGEDGLISFWALQRIQAGGRTVRELQEKIASLLADGFIKNPVVRVEIDKFKSQYVTILGEVRTQSRVMMQGTKSLLEALADAGGQTNQASTEAEVSHAPQSGRVPLKETIDLRDYQAAQAYMLHDQDVVVVLKQQQFYINGEVRNSGALVWQRGMTLAQAVTLAGGLTDRGTYRGAEATRVIKGKAQQVKLKEQSPVLPDDVITIGKRIF